MSFRRQVYFILKQGYYELKTQLKFNVGGFDYLVYATSNTSIKCFGCGSVGHLVRDCPKQKRDGANQAGPGAAQGEGTAAVSAGHTDGTGLMRPIPLSLSHPRLWLVPPLADPPAAAAGPPVADPPVVAPPPGWLFAGFASPAAESSASGSPAGPAAGPGPAAAGAELGAGGARVEGAVLEENIVFGAVADSGSAGCAVAGLVLLGPDAGSCGRAARAETERHDLIADIVTDMETDFKVPRYKRKSLQKAGSAIKLKKRESDTDVTDGEEVSSDSSWSECSQTDILRVVYMADQMKQFLINTKGQREVLVANFL